MKTDAVHWERLVRPGIISVVGAGGKTTVVSRLAEQGLVKGLPVMVTTTTKMGSQQVAPWEPWCGDDYEEGERYILDRMESGRIGAWFQSLAGHKVLGLLPEVLDRLEGDHPDWMILSEADGAKKKWLKAPELHEPVVPQETVMTIGVLNLQILGKPLEDTYVHRLHKVAEVMGLSEGDIITPHHVARLLAHDQGMFQYARGERVLFCTGYDQAEGALVDELLAELKEFPFLYVVLADGYRETCYIREVRPWQSVVYY